MFKQFSFASTIIYLWYFFVNINISSKSISVPSRSPTYTILCGTEFAHCSTAACCRRESREARTVGLLWRKVFGRFYNILQKKSKEYIRIPKVGDCRSGLIPVNALANIGKIREVFPPDPCGQEQTSRYVPKVPPLKWLWFVGVAFGEFWRDCVWMIWDVFRQFSNILVCLDDFG